MRVPPIATLRRIFVPFETPAAQCQRLNAAETVSAFQAVFLSHHKSSAVTFEERVLDAGVLVPPFGIIWGDTELSVNNIILVPNPF